MAVLTTVLLLCPIPSPSLGLKGSPPRCWEDGVAAQSSLGLVVTGESSLTQVRPLLQWPTTKGWSGQREGIKSCLLLSIQGASGGLCELPLPRGWASALTEALSRLHPALPPPLVVCGFHLENPV